MKTDDTVKMTIRIDKDVKEGAEKVCAQLGISLETAIKIFICKIINEQGIPFIISLHHTGPVTTPLPDKYKQHGPILARYDAEARKAYLEFPDGSRDYV